MSLFNLVDYKLWPTTKPHSPRLGGCKPRTCPLYDHIPLEIRKDAEQAVDHLANARRGIDPFRERNQVRSFAAQLVREVAKMAKVAAQPIEPPYHDLVAGLERLERRFKLRPFPRPAADLLTIDAPASGSAERVDLEVQRLIVGRDASVTNAQASLSVDGINAINFLINGGSRDRL